MNLSIGVIASFMIVTFSLYLSLATPYGAFADCQVMQVLANLLYRGAGLPDQPP